MSVIWTATTISGRFGGLEVTSSIEDFAAQFAEIRSRGEGYVEVRAADGGYPYLSLGFRAGHAAIHRARTPESMSLLGGDGSLPAEAEVDIPIMDIVTAFAGTFVLTSEHAASLLLDFAGTGREPQGDWWEL